MNSDRLVNLIETHMRFFPKIFLVWVPENMTIVRIFFEIADTMWMTGQRNHSSMTIVGDMRYQFNVQHRSVQSRDGDTFKIPNKWAPNLSRLYALVHPDRVSMFMYRVDGFGEYMRGENWV